MCDECVLRVLSECVCCACACCTSKKTKKKAYGCPSHGTTYCPLSPDKTKQSRHHMPSPPDSCPYLGTSRQLAATFCRFARTVSIHLRICIEKLNDYRVFNRQNTKRFHLSTKICIYTQTTMCLFFRTVGIVTVVNRFHVHFHLM